MNEQDLLVAFLKALPNGQTRYPMELIINKMGTSIDLNLKLKLKSIDRLDNAPGKVYKLNRFEIRA